MLAVAQHDWQIELSETRYQVGPGDSSQISYHQRYKALTAAGRDQLRQIRVYYITSFQEPKIAFIKTIKKDGSVIEGERCQRLR